MVGFPGEPLPMTDLGQRSGGANLRSGPRGNTSERTVVLAAALVLAVLLTAPVLGRAAGGPPYSGRTLADVLGDLQARGLKIIYSSATVRANMVVQSEPTSTDPRTVLDDVLRPHRLRVQEGPGEILTVVMDRSPDDREATGSIRGKVSLSRGAAAIGQTLLTIEGTALSTKVSDDGSFEIGSVPVGIHVLEARLEDFQPQRVEGVRIRRNKPTTVRFSLVPIAVFLNEIFVTPSHFRILEEQPDSRQFLSREEVDRMPHVADDIYRAVKRLPGAAGSDYSAKFNVRGGEEDEVLVILDGIELYEPFHFKDFQNIFSTVDAVAVGGVDFMTAGFPAEYGDRMSGVMNISLVTPTTANATSVSVGTLNARIFSEGMFNDGRGTWLVSGRAWYPDALLNPSEIGNVNILTDYYDLLAKVQIQIGSRSTLSANVLLADDDLGYRTVDETETEDVQAQYRSHHLWFNLGTEWNTSLFSQTVIADIRLKSNRVGRVDDVKEGTLSIDDIRSFSYLGIKQNWTLEIGDRHFLKWGFDISQQEAGYDYTRTTVGSAPPAVLVSAESVVVEVEPKGKNYSAFAADRFRLLEDLVVEVGLRWDKQFYIGEHEFSPRFNLMYGAGPRTTLRLAWGRFHQSQRLNELQVEDGVTEFFPAQLAEHVVVGLDHRLSGTLAFRVEAYRKDLSDLRPRFENLFDPIDFFPEAADDRVLIAPESGRTQGVEVLLKRTGTNRTSWWVSYALASADDEIDGEIVPRSWDQRHAVSAGFNWSLPKGWNINLAGTFHTGWPTTGVTAETVINEDGEEEVVVLPGPRNGERFPSYLRFDMRTSWTKTTRRGEFTLIFEAVNFTNRKNVCCVQGFDLIGLDNGTWIVRTEAGYWAPIIPSLEIRWQF
ncbi:MAG: TonB-dependent receptor domain-containing protein [Thermoanaerobaculales bacterium]